MPKIFSLQIAQMAVITRTVLVCLCISVAISFRLGPTVDLVTPTSDLRSNMYFAKKTSLPLTSLFDASLSRPAPAAPLRSKVAALTKFFPCIAAGSRQKKFGTLRAEGQDGQSAMPQTGDDVADVQDDDRTPLARVPDRTLQQVRAELAKGKLQCPFPSEHHARGDFFEALLQRLGSLDAWADRYDASNPAFASKQARLEVAMHAVRNVAAFELGKDEINAVAKKERRRGTDDNTWRLAADFYRLELTVIEVVPRPYSAEWLVQRKDFAPVSEEEATQRATVVASAGRFWSAAPLEGVGGGRALDDDWTEVDWAGTRRLTTGEEAGEEESEERAGGEEGADASRREEWPPRAPQRTQKQQTAAELGIYDNVTLVGQNELLPDGPRPQWRVSKEVEAAYNPALIGEDMRRRRGGMRTKYFHGYKKFPRVGQATREACEDEWDGEIDKIMGTMEKYQRKQIAAETFVKRFHAHWRQSFRIPERVKAETFEEVRAEIWREYGVQWKGGALDGETGVDKLYDKAHFGRLWEREQELQATLCIDSPVYWGARALVRSPLTKGAMNPPDLYEHLAELCDLMLNPARTRELAGLGELPEQGKVEELQAFLERPAAERRLVGDYFKPEEHEIEVVLPAEQKREVFQFLKALPTPPEGMTHAEVAMKAAYPDAGAVQRWYETEPKWFDPSDTVLKYGRATVMDRRQMARFVWEMRVREKHATLEYSKAMKNSGHRGLKLKRLLRLLPRSWEENLADDRPMGVEAWLPEGGKPIKTRGQMLTKAFAKRASKEGFLDAMLRAREDYVPGEEDEEEWWLQEARALGDEIEGEEAGEEGGERRQGGGGEEGGGGSGGDPPSSKGPRGSGEGQGDDEEEEEDDDDEGAYLEALEEAELSVDYVRGAAVRTGGLGARSGGEQAGDGEALGVAARGESGAQAAMEGEGGGTSRGRGAEERPGPVMGGGGAVGPGRVPGGPGSGTAGGESRKEGGVQGEGGVWVPEWLEGDEDEAAVRDGRAQLGREPEGWYVVYEEEEEEEEVGGRGRGGRTVVGEAVEQARLEGGREGAGERRHEGFWFGEWKSVRLEKSGVAAMEEGSLQGDEFFLEYAREDEEDEGKEDEGEGGEKERVAGQTEGLTNTELAHQRSLYRTLEEWMEAKRGKLVRAGADDALTARVLTAEEDEEVLVQDLKDGVFGKSVYVPPMRGWAVDDRLEAPGQHVSDLEQVITMARAYGWWGGTEELEKEVARSTMSLHDYGSVRFREPPGDAEQDRIAEALTGEGLHFAMGGEEGLLMLAAERWEEGMAVLGGLGYGGQAVVEGEFRGLIAHDALPEAVWNKLCGWDYGEVQFWEVDLWVPNPPPGPSLVPEEERGLWLVPSKFADWLQEDLVDRGWRSVAQAMGGEERGGAKVVRSGEYVSLRFEGGKPPAEVEGELTSGRFGEVYRLGDYMFRPTEVDYEISMRMKDAWMVPAEREREILLWLLPDAEQKEAEERAKREEIARLKREKQGAGADEVEATPGAVGGSQRRVKVLGAESDAAAGLREMEALQAADGGESFGGAEESDGRGGGEEEGARRGAEAEEEAEAMAAAGAEQLAAEAAMQGKEESEVELGGEGEDEETKGEGAMGAGAMVVGGGALNAGAAVGGGGGGGAPGGLFGALRYAVENMEERWGERLQCEFEKDYFLALAEYLRTEVKMAGASVYPPPNLIFNAFNLCPFDKVKVVIVGQDPYHGEGQAHGLAFSVPPGQRVPPSLRNILQELQDDPEVEFAHTPGEGDLSRWAAQGVLLLNTVLTVRAGEPLSHDDIGWNLFTDTALSIIAQEKQEIIFLLWGANAQKKAPLLKGNEHLVLKASHPSPLSATKGRFPFLGSRHFSKVNQRLKEQGKEPIDWSLAD